MLWLAMVMDSQSVVFMLATLVAIYKSSLWKVMVSYSHLHSKNNASVSPVDLPSQIISLVSPCTGNVVDIPLLCLYLETCMVLLLPYVPQPLILNICCLPHC